MTDTPGLGARGTFLVANWSCCRSAHRLGNLSSTFAPSLQAPQYLSLTRGLPLVSGIISLINSAAAEAFHAGRHDQSTGRPPPPALRSGPKAFGHANQIPLSWRIRPFLGSGAHVNGHPRQPLQGPSDIAESGGAPRQATAWETEARSVLMVFARSVNTEGPRP